jgi:hypothetical protein
VIDHVQPLVADFEGSKAYYQRALESLGHSILRAPAAGSPATTPSGEPAMTRPPSPPARSDFTDPDDLAAFNHTVDGATCRSRITVRC